MTETELQVKTEHRDPIMKRLIDVVGRQNVSDSEIERIAYSGDPSSLPRYHYRWKKKDTVDYVVKVRSAEEIQGVLEIARENEIPVIPRGGASSCMGSSSPTRGGISLDIKPMNKVLEINEQEMYARIEPGVTFDRLEYELGKKGFTLGIYPSSAKSAVIGGWMACGGRGGIGTPLYGSLRDNTLEVTAVKVDGTFEKLNDEDVGLFCGSFGIYGVITELKVQIRKEEPGFLTLSYSFTDLKQATDAFAAIAQLEKRPLYLKMADDLFQSYSNPTEKGTYILTASYPSVDTMVPRDEIEEIVDRLEGKYKGEEYSAKEWDLRLDCEFIPKEHCESLMFQEVLIDVDKAYELLKQYEWYRDTYKIPAIWTVMLGTELELRVELMTLLDPDKYLKFISSKGILHKMIKQSIELGGGPYTIGLQNSIYMEKAFPERQKFMREVKEEWDPQNIMNPDRVTSCLTSYRRINLMFNLAVSFRRLSKYIDREEFTGAYTK